MSAEDEGFVYRVKQRRGTLERLPRHLLAMVDGGKLSAQGKIDRLLASKTPAEVRQHASFRSVSVCLCAYLSICVRVPLSLSLSLTHTHPHSLLLPTPTTLAFASLQF